MFTTLPEALACYESPCGFMRHDTTHPQAHGTLLRIPMWVYEFDMISPALKYVFVTNPHVGL